MARGNRLLENERYAEAVTEFKETHRLWPSEAAPLVDLAQTYFRMGQNPEALNALKEALELQPGNPAALSILAVYSIQIGDKAGAASYYHQLEQHAGTVGPVAASLRQSYQNTFGEELP
jgi:Flp pilus assembly protein TadD